MNAAVYNKGIIAILGGAVQIANLFVDLAWVTPDALAGIADAITAVLVIWVPNKK